VFEYDSVKSRLNKSKHGLDFEEAQLLWSDPRRVEIKASSTTESRFMVIGQVAGKCWSAIITYRENNIRIISVRRSRDDEVKVYES
jgi:uncharacterized protein